jgi:UDP-glucuronate decarboxylase
MMDSPRDFTGPVNLGNPEENTILDIAQKILDLTNSSSTVEFTKLPADDPSRRQPDISLAQDRLGWFPKVKLEDGLPKTIAYFEKILF